MKICDKPFCKRPVDSDHEFCSDHGGRDREGTSVTVPVSFILDTRSIEHALEGAKMSWGRYFIDDGADSILNATVFDRLGAASSDKPNPRSANEYKLTTEKVVAGIALCAIKHPKIFMDLVRGTGDAFTGDAIVQLTIFGEVLYA